MFEVESIDKDVVGVWMRIIIEWFGGKHTVTLGMGG